MTTPRRVLVVPVTGPMRVETRDMFDREAANAITLASVRRSSSMARVVRLQVVVARGPRAGENHRLGELVRLVEGDQAVALEDGVVYAVDAVDGGATVVDLTMEEIAAWRRMIAQLCSGLVLLEGGRA